MTSDEIYEFARRKQPAPDDLTLCEQMLYTTARNIYKAYSDGIITLEQAKKEKSRSITAFGTLALSERVYLEHRRRTVEISRVLAEAEKCGCEYCKKVSEIFDGRLRTYDHHEFYKCGAKFDNIASEIRAENRENSRITADCEPRSNSELTERGLRVTSAKKGRGSVEHGITWLQNLAEIVIDPARCPNTFREFYGYELESDNNGGFRDGFPDRDNHSIDAVRYALEADMLRKKAKTHDRKELGIY